MSWAELLTRVKSAAVWRQLLATARNALTHPAANPRTTALVAGVILVAVLLVVVLLVLLMPARDEATYEDEQDAEEPPSDEERERDGTSREEERGSADHEDAANERVSAPRKPRRRVPGNVWTLAGVLLAIAALVSAWSVTSSDAYCAGNCHSGTAVVEQRAKDPHKTVGCVACHEDPLPLGVVDVPVSRIGHLVESVRRVQRSGVTIVPVRRCLACHRDILGRTITVGPVRMSHAEPQRAGMTCDDCHTDTGHGGNVDPGAAMSECVVCHDGRKARNTCATCHTKDAYLAAAASVPFEKVYLGPPTDCGGCHAQTTCDACHGIRMPHSEEFKAQAHARFAAFDKKQMCWKCHSALDCTKCHERFGAIAGHGAAWKDQHKLNPPGSACACHQTKEKVPLTSFCDLCHAPSTVTH